MIPIDIASKLTRITTIDRIVQGSKRLGAPAKSTVVLMTTIEIIPMQNRIKPEIPKNVSGL
jgi:hypothetical protein